MLQKEKVIRITRVGVIISLTYIAVVIIWWAGRGLYRSLLEERLYQTLSDLSEDLFFIVAVLLWNLSPLVAAYLILKGAEERQSWVSIAFVIGVVASTLYFQFYYTLASFGLVHTSSTEAIGLLFFPVIQFGFGFFLSAFVMIIIVIKALAGSYFLNRR